MFGGKYGTVLTIFLILAIIGIVVLLSYLGYSMYSKYYTDAKARGIVETFQETVKNENVVEENTIQETIQEPDDSNIIIIGGESDNQEKPLDGSSNNKKAKTTYNGYTVIGTISIPKIKIEYPILEKVTTKSLKYGVAYLVGVGINKPGNTVIQGHNYRNGLFFSNLSKLSNGDDIYITDTSGQKVQYKVYRNFSAEATDTSFYKRDTGGKREITLSTCTEDARIRTVILAKEV